MPLPRPAPIPPHSPSLLHRLALASHAPTLPTLPCPVHPTSIVLPRSPRPTLPHSPRPPASITSPPLHLARPSTLSPPPPLLASPLLHPTTPGSPYLTRRALALTLPHWPTRPFPAPYISPPPRSPHIASPRFTRATPTPPHSPHPLPRLARPFTATPLPRSPYLTSLSIHPTSIAFILTMPRSPSLPPLAHHAPCRPPSPLLASPALPHLPHLHCTHLMGPAPPRSPSHAPFTLPRIVWPASPSSLHLTQPVPTLPRLPILPIALPPPCHARPIFIAPPPPCLTRLSTAMALLCLPCPSLPSPLLRFTQPSPHLASLP